MARISETFGVVCESSTKKKCNCGFSFWHTRQNKIGQLKNAVNYEGFVVALFYIILYDWFWSKGCM